MLNFEGSVSEPSRRSNDRVIFENKNEDVMCKLSSTMTSVAESDWEDNINTNASASFAATPSSDKKLIPISNVAFCKATSLNGEIYKLSAHIGSCIVSSKP